MRTHKKYIMETKSIFAKILDSFDDIVEDWAVTADEIKCYLYAQYRSDKDDRVEKLVNMLTVASFVYNQPKVITIGGKMAYVKLSPSEVIKTKKRVKSLIGSQELLSEVSSISDEGEEFKYEDFIKAVSEGN